MEKFISSTMNFNTPKAKVESLALPSGLPSGLIDSER